MRLCLVPADPAGNVTLLVKTPVEREQYSRIAARLLALPELGGEQVGFLTAPLLGGDVRLEMMGGEFCGNALRSAGLWFAAENGRGPCKVAAEISGIPRALTVEADPGAGTAKAQLPPPSSVERLMLADEELDAARFEGILHFVCDAERPFPAPEKLREALRGACARYKVPAAGLMRYEERAGKLTPAVYVLGTDSLFFEQSCASGSAAVAALAVLLRKESAALSLRQPGGVIEAQGRYENGALTALFIGGTVTLGTKRKVELSL